MIGVEDFKTLSLRPGESRSEFVPRISHLTSSAATNGHESAIITAACLEENHIKNHCFFNDRGFHNHIVHHLLALYSLGSPPQVIMVTFENEKTEQRPIVKVDDHEFDSEKWAEYVGQEKYYGNYLEFFKSEINKKGSVTVVEEYIFRPSKAELFNRQWGYGLEFNLDAIVAEGSLAIAAVHDLSMTGLELKKLLKEESSETNFNGLISRSKKKVNDYSWPDFAIRVQSKVYHPKLGLSSLISNLQTLKIIFQIMQEDELAPKQKIAMPDMEHFEKISQSPQLAHWINQWKIEPCASVDEIFQKTQELLWLVTVLYAASFDERRGVYVLDFAVMHLVTSALFLPTIISAINPSLHPALLTAFFKVSVTVWVAMGRPRLQLSEILRDPANVELPRDQNPNKGENPWFKVLSSAARHPDEHTTKVIFKALPAILCGSNFSLLEQRLA
ncbi:hypothetical protein BY996DRAFT_4587563 [Phakopsora pachyrhizi]|uniref:Uncharacterized protein n=2 Tax=Phakopsora pachyrhizi TaxID=170000 RepID=A0AAV0B5V3_PHAPC|nr:hypothetical protein BY996DRAFT_4587563 [Phakopsora pachyrhizi]CAH7682487.1 hypothetical protein PPACK8108_LOCUS15421 [Phakopsora pachyrhizi]